VQDPADIQEITRPTRTACDALAHIGSATCSSELSLLGIRDPQIRGPRPLKLGRTIAGPALTLQMMPQRGDLFDADEYENPERQLNRHVLYQTQPGDIIVVDARGDMASGVFGEMMLTFFAGRGGAGIVVDGCIRDSARANHLDIGIWVNGVTPNHPSQTNLMPFAVNVPVACGDSLVIPGDIIVADDDGVVVVPAALADKVIAVAGAHAEWEEFSMFRLLQGADLNKYYPLNPGIEEEYRAWRASQPSTKA
jgi:regulator of RNase E activity RraA